MALPLMGRGASLGLGAESTYGTPTARSNWIPITSASLMRKVQRPLSPSLVGIAGSYVKRNIIEGAVEAGGSVSFLVEYTGLGLIWEHATGATPSTTNPSNYIHVYTIGALPVGLTAEWNRSGQAGNVSQVFDGCKISRLGVSCRGPSDPLIATVDFIAEDAATLTTAGSPAYGTSGDLVVGWHGAGVDFGGASYKVIDFDVTIDNKLVRRPKLAGQLTEEPTRSDFAEITFRATIEWENNNLQAAYRAATASDLSIEFASGTDKLKFEVHNAVITDYDLTTTGPGVITQTVTWTGLSDGTDRGLEITATNDDASAVAN